LFDADASLAIALDPVVNPRLGFMSADHEESESA
jgi:hypothetical protein